jgi:hypothetical protein
MVGFIILGENIDFQSAWRFGIAPAMQPMP